MLASADADGADGRIVVLRAVDRDSARLTFFTDARAAKVAAVARQPRVAVVAWDPAAQRQVRLRGTGAVATAGAGVEAAWAQVPPSAGRAYRTVAAPGTPLATPDFADGDAAHFAVLTVALDRVEWLDLAGPAHRRAASPAATANGPEAGWCLRRAGRRRGCAARPPRRARWRR